MRDTNGGGKKKRLGRKLDMGDLLGLLVRESLLKEPRGDCWGEPVHHSNGICQPGGTPYVLHFNLSQSVFQVVLQKSTPPQIRQLMIYYY